MKRAILIFTVLAMGVMAWGQDGRTIRDITIRGNLVSNQTLITTAMSMKPGGKYDAQSAENDKNAILDIGFYRKVEIYTTPINDNDVNLLVDVDEYPVIKEIRIEGNSVYSDDSIKSIILSHQEIGQIWNNRNGPKIVKEVRDLYAKDGYFAEFSDLSPMADSPGTLNAVILEAKLGSIEVQGLTRTRPSTVERAIKSKPGEAFNLQRFRDDMGELYQTNWFETLEPVRKPGSSPEVFDFIIKVKEARTANLNAGIAVDPQGRLVGTFSYGDSNFRGTGQNVGFQLNQATAGGGPSASLAYTNRYYDRNDTVFTARVFSEVIYNFNAGLLGQSGSSDTDQFTERRTGGQVQFRRPVSNSNTVTVGLTARTTNTVNFQNTGANNYIQQDGDLVSLQLGYDYNTARPTVEPVRGQAISVLLEPGYSNIRKIGGNVASFNNLLGTSNFIRSTFAYRQYWSKEPKVNPDDDVDASFKPRPVVAFKAEYGLLSGDVPFFEQLFLGGNNSLRGYNNQRFWGNQSALATLEYRHPITSNFTAIGFADYGSAWGGYGELPGFEQTDKPNFRLGYGVGVAFRTPLGPIRIDFAFNDEGGSRTHFVFGTSF